MIYFLINLPLVSNMALITIFSKKTVTIIRLCLWSWEAAAVWSTIVFDNRNLVSFNKIENLLFYLTANKRFNISMKIPLFESFPFFPNFVIPDLDSYHILQNGENWKLVTRYEHNGFYWYPLISIAFYRLICTF